MTGMIVAHATASPSPSLWGARLRLVIDHGGLWFLQWLVPAGARWAAPMTRGFVALISPLHTHQKKGSLEVEKREFWGFWQVSVLQRLAAWGSEAGRAGVGPAGTAGGDGAGPSPQPAGSVL